MRCSRVWHVSVLRTDRARGFHWFPYRTLDASHRSMNSGGKVRAVVDRAETRESVQCATGSGVLSAMSMGTTLGCGAVTLGGGMATLGVGTGRLEGGVGVVATGDTGELVVCVMVGLGIQFVKMSWSFEMAVRFLWWLVAGESLMAQGRKLRVWTVRSPSLTVGLVRCLCRNSMLSENRSALVAPSTTWKQR